MYFAKSDWSAEARENLSRALDVDIDLIGEQVKRGLASLWIIDGGTAYMVSRREFDTLVIVAYQGSNLRGTAPYIIRVAQANGCTDIRFHTNNPALIRLLREYDPDPIEYVCRIKVSREH
jgi:hypothetical protein